MHILEKKLSIQCEQSLHLIRKHKKKHTCGWLFPSDVCGFFSDRKEILFKTYFFKSSNRFQTMWAKTCSHLHPCTPIDWATKVKASLQTEPFLLCFSEAFLNLHQAYNKTSRLFSQTMSLPSLLPKPLLSMSPSWMRCPGAQLGCPET